MLDPPARAEADLNNQSLVQGSARLHLMLEARLIPVQAEASDLQKTQEMIIWDSGAFRGLFVWPHNVI